MEFAVLKADSPEVLVSQIKETVLRLQQVGHNLFEFHYATAMNGKGVIYSVFVYAK